MLEIGYPFEVLGQVEDEVNALGEPIYSYQAKGEILAWLDLLSGSDLQDLQKGLMVESTHILITDDMPTIAIESTDRIKDGRAGKLYEVTYVDNILELDDHLEIYCKDVVGNYEV
ncbi:MAG: phage head-tail adapter protein [Aerococcus sanguinicola]